MSVGTSTPTLIEAAETEMMLMSLARSGLPASLASSVFTSASKAVRASEPSGMSAMSPATVM